MTSLKQIRVIPTEIVFRDTVLKPEPSLNSEQLADSMAEQYQPTPFDLDSGNSIYDLPVNTTGSLIGGFLECFPQQTPTLAIGGYSFTAINLTDGTDIHRSLLDDHDVLTQAFQDYDIEFTVNRETGMYKFSAGSTAVKSITVHVGLKDLNQL